MQHLETEAPHLILQPRHNERNLTEAPEPQGRNWKFLIFKILMGLIMSSALCQVVQQDLSQYVSNTLILALPIYRVNP